MPYSWLALPFTRCPSLTTEKAMHKQSHKKGFTLIELLVVIAIIGLLSTLAVVALNSARQKSRDTKRVADVKQIQTALELYYADEDGYPAVGTAAAPITLGADATKSLCGTATGFDASCGTNVSYMGLVPEAPEPADGGTPCATTNAYRYHGTASNYTIGFCLGAAVGDLGS